MISYEPLRKLMKEKGVTVKDLAEVNIFIGETLSGRKSMLTDKLDKLCKYFNCNVSDLVSYKREDKDCEKKVKLKIDWQLLKEELARNSKTFYTVAMKLNGKPGYFSSKAKKDLLITLDDLLFIAKEINCNPEEFLID